MSGASTVAAVAPTPRTARLMGGCTFLVPHLHVFVKLDARFEVDVVAREVVEVGLDVAVVELEPWAAREMKRAKGLWKGESGLLVPRLYASETGRRGTSADVAVDVCVEGGGRDVTYVVTPKSRPTVAMYLETKRPSQ